MATIAAISTAMGESGIGIIRVSGPDAIAITEKIFRAKNGKKLSTLPTHRLYYGHIWGEGLIDEVLVSLMRAPYSYTKEDIVEINCHGGRMALSSIMALLLEDPRLRMAEPGEFTKRAFLNGRIDLTQAEAVIDIIQSQTENALRIAGGQLQGRLSREIREILSILMDVSAIISVDVDYPEYENPEASREEIRKLLLSARARLEKLLKNAHIGKILREGIRTVIVGKPNVGKSSILNMLLGEERAIVTDIPGTTRDTLEERVSLAGIPLHIIDTAGIRAESDDPIEKIGIERSRKALESADLVLLVLDCSHPSTAEDLELLESIPAERSILILNKQDLPKSATFVLPRMAEEIPTVEMSATENTGMHELEEVIRGKYLRGDLDLDDNIILGNMRQQQLTKTAAESLESALKTLDSGLPADIISVDLDQIRDALGQIIGESVSADLLDHIFANFCLGK